MTTTADKTLKDVVNDASPNNINDAFRLMQLGDMLAPTKSVHIQAAAPTVTLSPPAAIVMDATVRDGAAVLGARHVADIASVPSAPGANGPGVATLSNDGTTLTFEDNVTDVIVTYMPRPAADMSTIFAFTGPV